MLDFTFLNRVKSILPPSADIYAGALVNLSDIPSYLSTGDPKVPLTVLIENTAHLVASAELVVDPTGLQPLDPCFMPTGALVLMAVGVYGLHSLDRYMSDYPGLPDSLDSFNYLYTGIL